LPRRQGAFRRASNSGNGFPTRKGGLFVTAMGLGRSKLTREGMMMAAPTTPGWWVCLVSKTTLGSPTTDLYA